MNIFLRLLLNALAILITAYLLPGVTVGGPLTAIVVAVVLGLINLFIKPILVILTLPITILTLGLFYVFINAILIQLTSAIVRGFDVTNFWWAVLFSIVLAIVNAFLNEVSKPQPPKYRHV
jgi:putative membrane protein